MSNPATHVESFDGSLGSFTGNIVPLVFTDGGWLAGNAAENLFTNPVGGGGTSGFTPLTGRTLSVVSVPAPLPGWLASLVTNCFRVVPSADGYQTIFAAGMTLTAQQHACSVFVYVPSSVTTTGIRLDVNNFAGATTAFANVDMSIRDEWQRIEGCLVTPVSGDLAGEVRLQGVSGTWGSGQPIYFVVVQVEVGESTTPISGDFGSGYAFTSTAHASTSTRAASSASVTMTEPVSVACWYREAYSGAKTFAYLDTLGQLGDYGDISYAAGDLTISTSRNLVIGPFAAFDRALTATEQANLRSTQNWSMNSVNGSNIILPLSGRRRPR